MLDALLVAGAMTLTGPVAPKGGIVDGDTLRIAAHPERIRLAAVDAPELDTPAGRAARDWLAAWLAGRTVDCTITGRGYYGRPLASCWRRAHPGQPGENVAAALVRAGHACVVRRWLLDAAPAERRALEGLRRCA